MFGCGIISGPQARGGQWREPASQRTRIRPPAVAGSFYAGHAQRLRRGRRGPARRGAGICWGFAQGLDRAACRLRLFGRCRRRGVRDAANPASKGSSRVVLIGPAHYVAVRGIAVPTADAFETPLGRVPVDRDALCGDRRPALRGRRLMRRTRPSTRWRSSCPSCRRCSARFALVPLLVGDADPRQVAEVLERLWGGPETLIVVSSDLSHYHDYDTARRLDAATAAAIERGEWTRARLRSRPAASWRSPAC